MIRTALIERVRRCDQADLAAFEPWFVAGKRVGRLHHEHVACVLATGVFARDEAGRLSLPGAGFAERSASLAAVVARLAADRRVRAPTGERYAVRPDPAAPPLLSVDRCAVAFFGTLAAGVHLNGFVRTRQGLELWLARRSRTKTTFPGHLDNVVAGGQSMDLDATATLRKECGEEADLPEALADRAIAAATIRYLQQDGRSLKPDTLQCFDLELPADFTPRPCDGEVEGFERWPLADVVASLAGDDLWKPNSALVVLDFLLRHGAFGAADTAALRAALDRAARSATAW
jgi:hypothetical protein